MIRILNVGCGRTLINNAINIDNSLSIKLGKIPVLVFLASKVGLIKQQQKEYIDFLASNNVVYANCTKLPVGNQSCDLVYSSHMCEHLTEEDLRKFIFEAYRVLKAGGDENCYS